MQGCKWAEMRRMGVPVGIFAAEMPTTTATRTSYIKGIADGKSVT